MQARARFLVGWIGSGWVLILGWAFVFALPRLIDQFSLLPQHTSGGPGLESGDLNALIYGLLIVVFLLFEPGGVIGLARRRHWLTRLFNTHGGAGGEPAETTDLPVTH